MRRGAEQPKVIFGRNCEHVLLRQPNARPRGQRHTGCAIERTTPPSKAIYSQGGEKRGILALANVRSCLSPKRYYELLEWIALWLFHRFRF